MRQRNVYHMRQPGSTRRVEVPETEVLRFCLHSLEACQLHTSAASLLKVTHVCTGTFRGVRVPLLHDAAVQLPCTHATPIHPQTCMKQDQHITAHTVGGGTVYMPEAGSHVAARVLLHKILR